MALRRSLKLLWVKAIVRVWPLARLWYSAWGLRLDGHPDDAVWYFAYGSNMHEETFRKRRKMQPVESRAGRIRNYRLRFNLDGRPRGKAAPANIRPDPDAEVWGALYRISLQDLVILNASEGIPGRRYRPVWLDAEDLGGETLKVATYMADGHAEDGRPSHRYITLLRQGARAHGLPQHWIAYLDGVRHAE